MATAIKNLKKPDIQDLFIYLKEGSRSAGETDKSVGIPANYDIVDAFDELIRYVENETGEKPE